MRNLSTVERQESSPDLHSWQQKEKAKESKENSPKDASKEKAKESTRSTRKVKEKASTKEKEKVGTPKEKAKVKEKERKEKAKVNGNQGKEKEKERTSTDGHENLIPPTGPELTSGQCTSRNATDMHHMEKDSKYSSEEWDGQTPTTPRDQTDQYVDSFSPNHAIKATANFITCQFAKNGRKEDAHFRKKDANSLTLCGDSPNSERYGTVHLIQREQQPKEKAKEKALENQPE